MKLRTYSKEILIKDGGIKNYTLTRLTNRLISEYMEVFGTTIPYSIREIADKIKCRKDIEAFDDSYSYITNGYGRKEFDTCETEITVTIRANTDINEFGEPIYSVFWYFYSCDTYKAQVNGKKFISNDYSEIVAKVTAEKGKYRYFCTHRPPSDNLIPKNYISYTVYCHDVYKGEATYNEQPTQEELIRFGLIEDETWEEYRNPKIQALETFYNPKKQK